MKLATFTSLLFLTVSVVSAATIAADTTDTFTSDSLNSIRIIQPVELENIVSNNSAGISSSYIAPTEHNAGEDETIDNQMVVPNKVAGYRVQVFSDNNQRTAKGEARSKESKMREAFPAFNTYIVYNSPFWRLKVGDFRTRDEAEAAADAIRQHFPSFAREIRVVKDRINK